MNNFKQQGGTIRVTATGNLNSGDAFVVGTLVAVAQGDIASGAAGVGAIEGVFSLPKDEAVEITQGAKVIWDLDGKTVIVTGAAAGDIVGFGVAMEAAGNGPTSVLVKLTPGAGTVQGG